MKVAKSNPVVLIDYLPQFALKDLFLILGGVAFMVALSHLRIYLPNSPIPHTGQTLGVLLISLSFGFRRSLAATGLFLMARPFIGLPIEIQSTGYLAGMFIASGVLGYMTELGWGRKFSHVLLLVFIGKLIIYSSGVMVLSNFIGWKQAISFGVVPFIPTMILKAILCAWMLPVAYKVAR